MRLSLFRVLILATLAAALPASELRSAEPRLATAPLYRDPIYDGAADPVVFWNHVEQSWWMLYTQRRANVDAPDVAYCFGSKIGVASTEDNGRTWIYRGALDLEFSPGMNTFWAPDIVRDGDTYHVFVTFIRGVRYHWGGPAQLAHYTSSNLWEWTFEGLLDLGSPSVIDGTVFRLEDGPWRLWYKDQTAGSITKAAQSPDLRTWDLIEESGVGGRSHEGPIVFRFQDAYWLIADEWEGMGVFRSTDTREWERTGRILEGPSSRPEDRPSGAHGDVVVVDDKIYIFYFTHPARAKHLEGELDEDGVLPYRYRRSSIQVAELRVESGTLVAVREGFDFHLPSLD